MAFVRGHFRRTSGGYSYVSPHYRSNPGSGAFGKLLLLIIGALVVVARFIAANILAIVLLLIVVAVVWAIVSGVKGLGGHRLQEYLDLCRELSRRGTLEPDRLARMNALAGRLPADSQARHLGEVAIYRDLIARILADGKIDDNERRVLGQLEQALEFNHGDADTIKQDGFAGLLTTLRGHLDENAEWHARRTAEDLGLNRDDIDRHLQPLIEQRERILQGQREHAARLEEAAHRQAEREAGLERDYRLAADVMEAEPRPKIETTVRLSRAESAWYETPAVELKRFKKGDRRQSGHLLVTDRRLLFVGEGTTTIRLDRVLDVAADIDGGTLHVVKDGRKRPFIFEIDQPLLLKAHVERSLAELT